MKRAKPSSIAMAVMVMLLLSSAGGLAFAGNLAPMTPELAAKREMVGKQRAQRVTHLQRKSAGEALKAERMKVYQARKAAQQSVPAVTNGSK